VCVGAMCSVFQPVQDLQEAADEATDRFMELTVGHKQVGACSSTFHTGTSTSSATRVHSSTCSWERLDCGAQRYIVISTLLLACIS